MNPALILALISDLYAQVTALTQENAALRAEIAALTEKKSTP
jgi:cell division protein FtsB